MKRKLDQFLGIPLLKALSIIPAKQDPGAAPLRKVLLIKLAAAGDTLLLMPVIGALREALPACEIHWLVSPATASLARSVPYVNRVVVMKTDNPASLFHLLLSVRAEKYDAVLDYEQWARTTAILTRMSGAPVRIGFDVPGQHRQQGYTRTYQKGFGGHEIDDFYSLTEQLCPVGRRKELEFWETEEGKRQAQSVLQSSDDRLQVMLHPGCGWDGTPREWSIEQYSNLANWLMVKYGARIFLTGGPEERGKTAALNRALDGAAIDLAGRMSWHGTGSLLNAMDLVVSGNTGVMHLAAAMRRPQLALHGPTNPRLWGPINKKAVVIQSKCQECPCLKLGFEYHRHDSQCMDSISLDEVMVQAENLIETYAMAKASLAIRSRVETKVAA